MACIFEHSTAVLCLYSKASGEVISNESTLECFSLFDENGVHVTKNALARWKDVG